MKSHDLSLPAWGPYSKRYGGISHIPSLPGGRRFDLSVFPSLYRRGVTLPNVMWESGYHPWDCSGDLSRYTHRHELLWKDRLYTEVSFSRDEEDLARFACRTVNRSGVRQAVVFHLMGALHFPPLETYSAVPVRDMAPPAGEGLIYRDALDYAGLRFREDSPRRTLSPDGIIWGEVRDHGFTGGSGLGGGFGEREDDEVLYALPGEWDRTGLVWLRFRSEGGTEGEFLLDGGLRGETPFSGTGDWQILCLECRPGSGEEVRLKITGGAAADLDGLVFASPALREMPRFAPRNLNPRPEILPGPGENSLILKYESLENYYGLSWDVPGVVRHWDWGEPDSPMKHNVHEHNNREFPGDGKGHYTEVFTRPVYLEEGSERINGGMICTGDREEVRRLLARETGDGHALWTGFTPEERFFPEDSPYAFSVNRLAATALLNVVYPVRLLGGWIRHHTPGKWWDCLYTWDSGFIGLGFATLDLTRAEETLNTYLTAPDNGSAAFIHHGSPVPTQFFLYQEIFNRTGSLPFLEKYYDSLLRYHRFMAGREGSSTTGALKSGLLKTWDYFYNSGGWDDYCPQLHVHREGLEDRVAPAITTSMAVRTALILKGAAELLGRPTEELDRDIGLFSRALQTHSWDGRAGYFSYVEHDEGGEPVRFLSTGEGENFNAGFDGCYPLNGGLCTEEQEALLVGKLFSPEHLWTDTGLTAVDQTASYFRDNGYWNGAVWMSHQWIFWKTMLDLGRGEEAWRIASTALELWKRETEESYCCFEHFVTSTGRGAGWHHFGGLSSPVLNWYSAYFRPGEVTAGHDTWIRSKRFSPDFTGGEISLMTRGFREKEATVLVVLSREVTALAARLEGRELPVLSRREGAFEIGLPRDRRAGVRKIMLEGRG